MRNRKACETKTKHGHIVIRLVQRIRIDFNAKFIIAHDLCQMIHNKFVTHQFAIKRKMFDLKSSMLRYKLRGNNPLTFREREKSELRNGCSLFNCLFHSVIRRTMANVEAQSK